MKSFNRREFINTIGKYSLLGLGISSVLPACHQSIDLLATIGEATNTFSREEADAIRATNKSMEEVLEKITPEQEYYIGRTVSAVVLKKYKPYNNLQANQYINVLGQTLSQVSDKPETFGGYHFLIQDSDEINAFAAPGGYIFITRGMVRCCKHENAIAAVLAHEIGHVQHNHGLKAIKSSRLSSALTITGNNLTELYGSEDLKQLVNIFDGSIQNISDMLIIDGYSRSTEREADRASINIMNRVGYNPHGLVDMLRIMEKKLKPGGLDFSKTHPSPASRIEDIQDIIDTPKTVSPPAVRQNRFMAALGNV